MIPLGKNRIQRRRFLRCAAGGLGTAIALPSLEAMFSDDAAYAQNAGGLPRFLAIYQPNGHDNAAFHPNGSMRDLDFSGKSSEPLAPHMDQVTILRNMNGTQSTSNGNDHLVAIVSFLTGVPVPSASETRHKISADTFIANHYEDIAPTGKSQHAVISGSPFVDPQSQNYNNEQKDWFSTDQNGEKIVSTVNLQQVLDKMFSGLDPQITEEQRAARVELKKSMLDAVLTDARELEARLGAADRATVQSYLDNIRQLELRLAQGGGGVSCETPSLKWSRDWPTERKDDFANPYIDEHWRDTMKLLQVAFQCEAVRSVSYMLETEAGESGYANAGLGDSHAASHSGSAQYAARDRLHAEIFAEMLDLFKATPVGDGTLLDNTMVLWGAGIGVNHSRNQQMTVLAGYEGNGIQHGALRDFQNNQSAIPLMRTLLMHMNVITDADSFGNAGPGQEHDLIDLTS